MLQIHSLEVTPFAQNARVLFDTDSRLATVVDPGGDVPRIMTLIGQLDPAGAQVLLTHAHIDHGGGVQACLDALTALLGRKTPLLAHHDNTLRGSIAQQALLFGMSAREYQDVPEPDTALEEGDVVAVGVVNGEVLWTPGHAPDHISLFLAAPQTQLYDVTQGDATPHSTTSPVLIAGDALFAGSIGRTDLPGGSFPQLIQSIKEKLLTLPDETIVCAGHGPDTTIGEERHHNPFLAQ